MPPNDRLAAAFAFLDQPPRELKPVPFADAREEALINGLHGLANHFGLYLMPTHIDARGEMSFILDNGISGTGHPVYGYQVYGEPLAALLNHVPVRTGATASVGHVPPSGTWCYINHFAVEQLLIAFKQIQEAA